MSNSALIITTSLILIIICVMIIMLGDSGPLVAIAYFVIPVIIMAQAFFILFLKDDSKPSNPDDWYEQ